jgi:8-oxo-dGTP diphosphatase
MANQVHAVGTIIENNLGEILVLKRHKRDPEGNTYGLVGGKIDSKETEEQSAIREIKEEIGLTIQPNELEFVRSYHWDRSDLDIFFDVYKLSFKNDWPELILPKNEITNYMWDTPRNLTKRDDLMLGLYEILKTQYQLE